MLHNTLLNSEDYKNARSKRETKDVLMTKAVPLESLGHLVGSDSCLGLNIKYCGSIGRTGYSQAAKSYFYSLFSCGANLTFQMMQYYPHSGDGTRDIVLYSHLDRNIHYDIVILHCIPEFWASRAREEREKNPNILVVGLTVWETSKIHPRW
jgi:hypothetical protein